MRPNTEPASPARTAAQRAFFDAALNKAGASVPAAAPAPVARTQAAGAVQPAATRLRAERVETQTAEEAPQRILRPGSLIDIKV